MLRAKKERSGQGEAEIWRSRFDCLDGRYPRGYMEAVEEKNVQRAARTGVEKGKEGERSGVVYLLHNSVMIV